MQVARAVGAAGRAMMRVGAVLLLFVAFQLWGTGLLTQRAQDDLGREFRERQAMAGQTAPSSTLPPVQGAERDRPAGPAPVGELVVAAGDPVGHISIPDIGSEFFIVEGVDLSYLRDGPGHFPDTPLPGQPGNAALAGHRTTWAAPFHRIDELAPGAGITVETLQGSFRYEVIAQDRADGAQAGHRIIEPTDLSILDDKGDDRLTLMACHPKYSASQRIVVEARLVDVPAPPPVTAASTTPPTLEDVVDGELLAGDEAARLPAVGWSALALAIWFATWLTAKRWRGWRIPAYVVGVPLFAVAAFVAFSEINQLLPAAY